MANSIEILDKIAGRTPDTPLAVGSRADYDQDYELDDLGDNSLVPKRVLVGYVPDPTPDPVEVPAQGPGIISFPVPTGFTKYDARLFKDDTDAGTYYFADVTTERLRLDYGGLDNTQIWLVSNGDQITVRFSK